MVKSTNIGVCIPRKWKIQGGKVHRRKILPSEEHLEVRWGRGNFKRRIAYHHS